MRRIILAAFAVLLLHAAPSMAAECTNLALAANGGSARASSNYNWAYTEALLNNGRRDPGWGYYWQDGTSNSWPDAGYIIWSSARTINRIVVRGPAHWYPVPDGHRTLARARVQYWDDATSAWVDVASNSDANPIVDWTMPGGLADGSERKQFDFAPVSTSRIRVEIEDGASNGWSFLEEIEAYNQDGGCDDPPTTCVNRAPEGTVTASSVHSSGSYPLAGVTNGRRESGTSMGYWNDGTNGSGPDWVQVEWSQPVYVHRITARIPLARPGFPVGEITLRRTRIQYWDDTASAWVDVVDRNRRPNPILDWTGPISVYDGSESRTLDFTTVATTKIRALIEDGSSDGWSWLDELQAYSVECSNPAPGATPRDVNLALVANGGTATTSSEYSSSWPATAINNGTRQNTSQSYWHDHGSSGYPDWAQIDWPSRRSVNRIVIRGPVFGAGSTLAARTLGSVRIQYWDTLTWGWVDVVGRSGQANPIVNWTMPELTADGSETKQFDFATVRTLRIRALFEQGGANTSGSSWLDELEAHWVS